MNLELGEIVVEDTVLAHQGDYRGTGGAPLGTRGGIRIRFEGVAFAVMAHRFLALVGVGAGHERAGANPCCNIAHADPVKQGQPSTW